ncbi:MAG: enoyl-CoA hydratase/isomerase family protein [Candidatus Nanopelagicales bacterium]|nr:enoyl-CoA hydratase/isomerase family protein [Candidatus Nanopelagicales bacterium]
MGVDSSVGGDEANLLDPELSTRGGVELTVAAEVATVSLVRPQVRNAQVPDTWRALAAVADLLDDRLRVIVLRAEGKSFSAGLDRRMFTEGIPGEGSLLDLARADNVEFDKTIAYFQRGFTWWRDHPAVSIALVQGHAVGAGFQLALAADLMIVGNDAQLSMRETQLGLVPDLAGTHPLIARAGYQRGLEICLSGRWVGADEAVRIGLALRQVPTTELDAAGRELAESFLAAPAGATRRTKALLRGSPDRSFSEQIAAERAAQRSRIRDLAGLTGV